MGCTSLTSVIIPEGCNQIRSYAFYRCSNLSSIYIPSTLSGIGENALPERSIRLYVDGTSDALISLWNYLKYGQAISIIDKQSNKTLPRPYLTTVPTASSITLSVQNYYSHFAYTISAGDSTMQYTGQDFKITGLMPRQSLIVSLAISSNSLVCQGYSTFTTDALTMTTIQPKVISAGNVVVAAETNLDDAETNVGFEWRRTDWSNDFASNSGTAYLYEGTMEGYIRNLYTEKLWKYRPYYESATGNRYYGEWVGIDPTNTSYFEPTVHTYQAIDVSSTSARFRGYALPGSDEVIEQGFEYWSESNSSRVQTRAGADGHSTVTASGQLMDVTIENMQPATLYCYCSYVRTSKGTTYGEEMTFRTAEDMTGINSVSLADESHIVGYYNLQGRKITAPEHGVVIIRYSDGSTKKVFVK